jgi:hypothetical protein
MNLHSRGSLDPRWTKHHVPTVADFMLARVKVIRKSGDPSVKPSYDQATGTWTGTFTTIYEGAARIQPYGIIGDQMVAQDATGRRLMRVQVKDLGTGINLDDMLSITECPTDPELTLFTLEVRGSINSSNAWVTDLVCEANLKHA